MAKEANEALPASSGVDGLIAKLRDEGVSAGREKAEQIVADARAKANEIVEKANKEAHDHIEASRKESDAYRSAGAVPDSTTVAFSVARRRCSPS